MTKIHVFVDQVVNYSSKQHLSTNLFKITYYLLQLFHWWPLWGCLTTSALWKHKPHSFSKLSAFFSPGELPFPQLSLISGFLAPHQRRKGTVWGAPCQAPPPIQNILTFCEQLHSPHASGTEGKGLQERDVADHPQSYSFPSAQDWPSTKMWLEWSNSSPGSAQPLPLLIQTSLRTAGREVGGSWGED